MHRGASQGRAEIGPARTREGVGADGPTTSTLVSPGLLGFVRFDRVVFATGQSQNMSGQREAKDVLVEVLDSVRISANNDEYD